MLIQRFNVSPTPDSEPRIGNYRRFCKTRHGKYAINIGPQWYISLIVLLVMILLGVAVISFFLIQLQLPLQIGYVLIYAFMILISGWLLISDPGIADNRAKVWDEEEAKYITCNKCNTHKKEETEHCYYCNVCIYGFDHHCDFLGKCIGKNNLWLFYCYIAIVPIFFVGSIVMVGVSLQ